MSPRARSLLVQIGSFVLAGVLLYLALRGVDLGEILVALRRADYTWLLPLVAAVLLSHWLRAWRWQILIRALPETQSGDEEDVPSVRSAFYSVMIGYMVNYAAPRLGEFARTANLSSQTRLSFTGLFGTVVVERILDVIVLAAAVGSVFVMLLDRFSTIEQLFIDPIVGQLDRLPAAAIVGGIILLGMLVLLIYRGVLRGQDSATQRLWNQRVVPVLASFKDGLSTLVRSKQRGAIAFSTVLIWFLYLLMAYLPFVMLGSSQTYDISLLDTWPIMILGAIGVAIPSPGGTGSYHYITIQTLVHLYSVSHEDAATYAVLTHAAQMLLYVVTGAVCLLLQGTDFRALKERTVTAREEQSAS